jgi:ATP-dependent Zn protease
MEQPTLISVLIGWFPMLLLIGVWIYFMRRFRMQSASGMTQFQYMEELLKETRRHNDQLERLLATANDRLAALERKG